MNIFQLLISFSQFAFLFMIPTRDMIKKRMDGIEE